MFEITFLCFETAYMDQSLMGCCFVIIPVENILFGSKQHPQRNSKIDLPERPTVIEIFIANL